MKVWISDSGYVMYNNDTKLYCFIDICFIEFFAKLNPTKTKGYWMILK